MAGVSPRDDVRFFAWTHFIQGASSRLRAIAASTTLLYNEQVSRARLSVIAPDQQSLRPQTARWLALALACALAIAQLLLADHPLDHADAAEHADCALCLAGNSLDHAAAQRAAPTPATCFVRVPPDAPSLPTRLTRPHRANARAPPPLHA